MLWIISSVGRPHSEVAALRAQVGELHRAYLRSKDDMIFCAGPTQDDEGTHNIGSLWIIKANSRAEAQAFSDAEPFTQAGVFASVTITRLREGPLHLHPALAGKECLEYLRKQNLNP